MAQNFALMAVDEALQISTDLVKKIYTPLREKVADEVGWICKSGEKVVDLGGGIGFHALVGQLLGTQMYCVDLLELREPDQFYKENIASRKLAAQQGVQFIDADIINYNPQFLDNSLDGVMTIDCIEHLHHSPRETYHKMVKKIKTGGRFLIGAPNAANLMKRFRVAIGRNIFEPLDEWYGNDIFYGHVREPIVKDFHSIMGDLSLTKCKVYGRNWKGYMKYGSITRIFDYPLRVTPSLCSDIYILAEKS